MPLDQVQSMHVIESDLRAWSFLTAFRLVQAQKPAHTHGTAYASPYLRTLPGSKLIWLSQGPRPEVGQHSKKSLVEFSSK